MTGDKNGTSRINKMVTMFGKRCKLNCRQLLIPILEEVFIEDYLPNAAVFMKTVHETVSETKYETQKPNVGENESNQQTTQKTGSAKSGQLSPRQSAVSLRENRSSNSAQADKNKVKRLARAIGGVTGQQIATDSSNFGYDQSMAVVNAVLANQFITSCDQKQNALVSSQIITIISSVQRKKSQQEVIRKLNTEPLLVQMNFVAIACDNLGIQPIVPSNVWTRINNPYSLISKVTNYHIEAALEPIKKQDGYSLTWPKTGNITFSIASL